MATSAPERESEVRVHRLKVHYMSVGTSAGLHPVSGGRRHIVS